MSFQTVRSKVIEDISIAFAGLSSLQLSFLGALLCVCVCHYHQ